MSGDPTSVREGVVEASMHRVEGGGRSQRSDLLAAEEPMEVRVVAEVQGRRKRQSVAITMRTPGHDFELAVGFLFTEGVLPGAEGLWRVDYCADDSEHEERNVVEVHLEPSVTFDPEQFSRNVYTNSSCGVCGKASLEALQAVCPARLQGDFAIAGRLLSDLPGRLRQAQPVFSRTGGLHAAGLYDASGNCIALYEDVGRHNAVDKVIGSLLMADALPASKAALLVSGRASFELVQKSLMAGIPLLAAVGAPSSLAVETAREFGQTLVGFLQKERFNIYSGEGRVLA